MTLGPNINTNKHEVRVQNHQWTRTHNLWWISQDKNYGFINIGLKFFVLEYDFSTIPLPNWQCFWHYRSAITVRKTSLSWVGIQRNSSPSFFIAVRIKTLLEFSSGTHVFEYRFVRSENHFNVSSTCQHHGWIPIFEPQIRLIETKLWYLGIFWVEPIK